MSFNIVLYEPLIPPNTGSISRLTAATNTNLHLIEPLGFEITDRYLKRAGLDYWPWVKLAVHKDWNDFLAQAKPNEERMFFLTKFAKKAYWDIKFAPGDFLIFGNEERGFPEELHQLYSEQRYLIPMENENVRSLNLACCASTVLFEALRQQVKENP